MEKENRKVSEDLSDTVIPMGNSLRQKAEEILKNKSIKTITPELQSAGKPGAEQAQCEFIETSNRNEVDALKLLNELEVYQIEMEMQNEELKLALHNTANATALYDFAPVGYFTIGFNGTICQLNLNGANMLGKERSSLVNRNFKQFVTIDTLSGFHHFLLKIFETNVKQTCEVRLIIDGNPSIYVHLQGIISEDIHKCLVTGMDVTELKHTEEALRKSEERHRLLADNASDVIWTMDLEGRYTYISPSVQKLRGYTVDEVMQQSMTDVLSPESAAMAQSTIMQALEAMRTGKPIPEFHGELEMRCKDGSTIWTDVTSSAMFNKEGDFIGILGVSRNITDRKRAIEALRKSEERHRLLADNASDVIWTMDLEGHYTYVSPSVQKLRGYSPDEVMHQSMLDVLTPESAAIAQSRLNLALDEIKRGEPIPAFNSQLEQLCKDGSTVWTDVTSSAMFNKEGEFIGILGVSRNISRRKRVEEALRESEEKHRLILDDSSDPIFTFYPDGQYRYVNKAFADGVGRKLEEIIGMKIWDVFPKDEADKRFAAVKWVFENGEENVLEVRVPRPDGDRWYLTTVKPILNATGQVTTVICISKDISKHKRAEEALRESEAKYRALVNDVSDGFYMSDIHGVFRFANHALAQILGVEHPDMLVGRRFQEFVPPAKIDELMVQYHTSLETGIDLKVFSIEIIREDGTPAFIEIKPHVIMEGGKAIGSRGIICDITKRKMAEETLLESEARLRELNATKDKFFSIIAHDLKSPFNSIIGFSNLLTQQIDANNYKMIAKYAMIIQHSSKRAMDLLTNLLEWSRSQTGRMEFNPETIELGTLISEVIELLNSSAQQKNITIFTENTLDIDVFADRDMLNTIIRNLISNAIKFTYPNDQIVVSAEENPDELMVVVADNGVGIKKEAIGKLFRIDASYKTMGTRNEMGTGLGLLLCKEFVDKHGGKIWVESESGQGSKFCFTIPKR